ncbi:hypothetical protein PROFUN_07622 [Planoprotostelium fungivorum]|uniref:ribulose-phosphate 3-epimerase n=1 Tax=Planoprotostelium fungivorum TaxID=1890364 RepID=A0A2P6NK38_9EUKA|nr:hypothetical protein PROFUN_07622 [Planoprotostelium fungivorum]
MPKTMFFILKRDYEWRYEWFYRQGLTTGKAYVLLIEEKIGVTSAFVGRSQDHKITTQQHTIMPLPKLIAPSLLNSDFAKLADTAAQMKEFIESLRKHTDIFIDCHLMVTDPARWVKDFAKAGANSLTFHLEAVEDPAKLIDLIHEHGMKAAIGIKPKTSVESVVPFLDKVDMILTVEPGFGGQSFMTDMMPKVEFIRQKKPDLNIQVDGGVDTKNIHIASKAGATTFVVGSAIFKHPGKYEAIVNELRENASKL